MCNMPMAPSTQCKVNLTDDAPVEKENSERSVVRCDSKNVRHPQLPFLDYGTSNILIDVAEIELRKDHRAHECVAT